VRLIWSAWLECAHRAAAYQSLALLNVIYFVVFGPSALLARLLGRTLLDLDVRARRSYWQERPPIGRTLRELRRQF
jgi:hypothetical protein